MSKVIRDLPDTSSYWAAVWSVCAMPDVHVICDAPIGCYNLVATAVPDYTDAIPNIDNITPSVITEEEVGGTGTAPAVQRTYDDLVTMGKLKDDTKLIVISTAESEMIGSDLSDLVKMLKPGTTFFHSESLTDDEWVGRDRILLWLWQQYGIDASTVEPEAGLVNIIGPTYGCFNAPSDLHEVKRLIEGAGGRVNVVFPYESKLADIAQLAKAQYSVVLYKEFGHSLAAALGRDWLHAPIGMQATTQFVLRLGEMLGNSEQAKAFIKQEKATTLRAVWDLWKGPQGDWFNTLTVGLVGTQTYVDGLRAYLGDELGLQITFSATRPRKHGAMDNEAVRQMLHNHAPSFVFGSINEKIYLAEAGARHTNFIMAAFPGAVVCRSIGTPFMGYRGTVHIIQEIVNRLYDVLFNVLPLDGAYQAQKAKPNGSNGKANASPGNLAWSEGAKQLLDAALEKLTYIGRISASREYQMQVESEARARGLSEVSADVAAEVLSAK
jgi:3,8-divinyl chlorophyllide a/chlorophyllide a reductase subunit Z